MWNGKNGFDLFTVPSINHFLSDLAFKIVVTRCLLNYFLSIAVMGKVEGQGESWHGHVTAVTVAPEYRRQQLAKKLMNLLEDISDKM